MSLSRPYAPRRESSRFRRELDLERSAEWSLRFTEPEFEFRGDRVRLSRLSLLAQCGIRSFRPKVFYPGGPRSGVWEQQLNFLVRSWGALGWVGGEGRI